jgi:hypothetical protein
MPVVRTQVLQSWVRLAFRLLAYSVLSVLTSAAIYFPLIILLQLHRQTSLGETGISARPQHARETSPIVFADAISLKTQRLVTPNNVLASSDI